MANTPQSQKRARQTGRISRTYLYFPTNSLSPAAMIPELGNFALILALLILAEAGARWTDSRSIEIWLDDSVSMLVDEGEAKRHEMALQALREMNESILMVGGGLPIEIAGEVVGAIGVGGAPGTHLDDACAEAGLDAIGAASKMPAAK